MNRKTHAAGAGIAVALAAYYEARKFRDHPVAVEEATGNAIVAGGVSALCGSLPDLLEPATHPNHRQFFHSVVCAAVMIEGLRLVYHWRPDDTWQRLLRNVTLIVGGAYIVHIAMDATTAKSLPFLGNLP